MADPDFSQFRGMTALERDRIGASPAAVQQHIHSVMTWVNTPEGANARVAAIRTGMSAPQGGVVAEALMTASFAHGQNQVTDANRHASMIMGRNPVSTAYSNVPPAIGPQHVDHLRSIISPQIVRSADEVRMAAEQARARAGLTAPAPPVPGREYQSLADQRPELREPEALTKPVVRSDGAHEHGTGGPAKTPRGTGIVAGFMQGLAAGFKPK
jgi:hypothetical protein